MNSVGNELVLVDGSGYIFRAYYALPPMFRSDGLPVNAVFGFTNMLLKLIDDIQSEKGGNVAIAVIFTMLQEKHLEMTFIPTIKQIDLILLKLETSI